MLIPCSLAIINLAKIPTAQPRLMHSIPCTKRSRMGNHRLNLTQAHIRIRISQHQPTLIAINFISLIILNKIRPTTLWANLNMLSLDDFTIIRFQISNQHKSSPCNMGLDSQIVEYTTIYYKWLRL